ncbi:MAG: ribose-phosphate pyrophosphokinase-like domain-containing protein, partial [Coriobacteriia bacterium]|nr:ribose-phosphate pyrophosphokinase-like domain-containing protein [Coriobacteriia bacterium]
MVDSDKRMMVFAGTSNRELSEGVAKHLGVELGNVKIDKFANGEIYIRFLESVRGADVFLGQSSCTPVNSTLMELLIMTAAAKRASARTITAV